MWEPSPYDQDPFEPGESGPPEPLWALRVPGEAEPEAPTAPAAKAPILTATPVQPLLEAEPAEAVAGPGKPVVPGPSSGSGQSSGPGGSGPGVIAPRIDVQAPRTVLRRLSELAVAPVKLAPAAAPELPPDVNRMEQVLAGLEQQISAPRTPVQPSPGMPNLMERIRAARLRAEQARGPVPPVPSQPVSVPPPPVPSAAAPVVEAAALEIEITAATVTLAETRSVEVDVPATVAEGVSLCSGLSEQVSSERAPSDLALSDLALSDLALSEQGEPHELTVTLPVPEAPARSLPLAVELPVARMLPAGMDEADAPPFRVDSLDSMVEPVEEVVAGVVATDAVAVPDVAAEAVDSHDSSDSTMTSLAAVELEQGLEQRTDVLESVAPELAVSDLAASDLSDSDLAVSDLLDVPPPPPAFAELSVSQMAASLEEPTAPELSLDEPSLDEPSLDEPGFPLFLSSAPSASASDVLPPAQAAIPEEMLIPDDMVPPLPPVLAPGGAVSAMPAIPPAPAVPAAGASTIESKAAKRHLESLVGALDLEMNEGLAALNEQVGPSRGPQSRGSLGLSSTARDRSADANAERFVVFFMSGSRYGLPIAEVLEMANVPRTTPLPNAPDFIRGVANLRGEVLAVIDLRALLSVEAASDVLRERMIVVRSPQSDAVAGLIVDSVRGLARLGASEIVQPSGPVEDRVADFLQGVASHEDQVLNVLDTRKLFSAPEILSLAAV